jgi:hypothetical protein
MIQACAVRLKQLYMAMREGTYMYVTKMARRSNLLRACGCTY